MRTTIYKCDKCGNEDTTNELKIDTVGVFVGQYQISYSRANTSINLQKEWCLRCRIEAGLTVQKAPPIIEVKPITLEEMLREIIREEIQQ